MTVIRWLGQACFLLMTLGGAHILIDPPAPPIGYHIAAHSIPADLVMVSHEHSDHNFVQAAAPTGRAEPKIIAPLPLQALSPLHYKQETYSFGAGSLAADRVVFTRIPAYHDTVRGQERGQDTLSVVETGGLRIAHLGDIGELALTPEQVSALGRIDVLMLPVGGYFTVDGSQAAALVAQLHPRVVIPMHYRTQALTPELKKKLAPVDAFLLAMRGKANVVHVAARDLQLSPATLPKTTTIYVLRYK